MKPILLIFAVAAFSTLTAQTEARATYAANGKLIEVTDLQGLQTCSVSNVSGKVSKVKATDSSARVVLKREEDAVEFEIPLSNVKADDKTAMFKHLVTKGNTLEIAGYRCTEGSAPSAFSVRRVY